MNESILGSILSELEFDLNKCKLNLMDGVEYGIFKNIKSSNKKGDRHHIHQASAFRNRLGNNSNYDSAIAVRLRGARHKCANAAQRILNRLFHGKMSFNDLTNEQWAFLKRIGITKNYIDKVSRQAITNRAAFENKKALVALRAAGIQNKKAEELLNKSKQQLWGSGIKAKNIPQRELELIFQENNIMNETILESAFAEMETELGWLQGIASVGKGLSKLSSVASTVAKVARPAQKLGKIVQNINRIGKMAPYMRNIGNRLFKTEGHHIYQKASYSPSVQGRMLSIILPKNAHKLASAVQRNVNRSSNGQAITPRSHSQLQQGGVSITATGQGTLPPTPNPWLEDMKAFYGMRAAGASPSQAYRMVEQASQQNDAIGAVPVSIPTREIDRIFHELNL